MPFNPAYPYGTQTQQVTHQSVPPLGRKVVSADFATLYIGNVAVGLVQRFSPRETRPVAAQYELGNIYPVEYVPQTWSGEIETSRIEIFKDSLFDAFQFNAGIVAYDLNNYWPSNKVGAAFGSPNGAGLNNSSEIVTTIADIQWPIDIALHVTNPAPEINEVTITTYKECWITSFSKSYDSRDKVVAENVTFQYRDVQKVVAAIVSDSVYQGATG